MSDDEGQGVCCFLWQIIKARVSVVCVSVMMVRVGVVSCFQMMKARVSVVSCVR